MGFWSLLNQTAMVGKVAAGYVLFLIFTGAAFIVGYEKLHNLPVDPVSSGLLFGAFSWAIGTLNFHMAAGNLQAQAEILTQVQNNVPTVTRAQAQVMRDVSNIVTSADQPKPPVAP